MRDVQLVVLEGEGMNAIARRRSAAGISGGRLVPDESAWEEEDCDIPTRDESDSVR
jgi:hypothetical protein